MLAKMCMTDSSVNYWSLTSVPSNGESLENDVLALKDSLLEGYKNEPLSKGAFIFTHLFLSERVFLGKLRTMSVLNSLRKGNLPRKRTIYVVGDTRINDMFKKVESAEASGASTVTFNVTTIENNEFDCFTLDIQSTSLENTGLILAEKLEPFVDKEVKIHVTLGYEDMTGVFKLPSDATFNIIGYSSVTGKRSVIETFNSFDSAVLGLDSAEIKNMLDSGKIASFEVLHDNSEDKLVVGKVNLKEKSRSNVTTIRLGGRLNLNLTALFQTRYIDKEIKLTVVTLDSSRTLTMRGVVKDVDGDVYVGNHSILSNVKYIDGEPVVVHISLIKD